MSKAATKALEALLARTERAWTRDSGATISLRMSEVSFRAYFDLGSRRETDDFHAVMRHAERSGAIGIEWDNLAGENGQIRRIVLKNRDQLASLLAVTPLWLECQQATEILSDSQDHPGVRRLLDAWHEGKRPRGIGPDKAWDVLQSMRVITALKQAEFEDVPVRQLSANLFKDSKKIEGLLPILDFMTQDDETCSLARSSEEVLATLGLVRFPQPTLIAGCATLIFKDDDKIRVPSPYLGVAPQSLERIEVASDARYLLTVENYTTFNEIAKGKAGPLEGVVIYTAGMPSPSFLRSYSLALSSTSQGIPIYHWGDIDLGGFRIADILASQAERLGLEIRLWKMNPEKLLDIPRWRELTNTEMSWIKTIAGKRGWAEEWAGVEATGAAYEQEMLKVDLRF